MATVTVKSTQNDKRVAFFERDPAHPNGQVFVRGDGKEVKVGDTRALRKAIRDNKLVLTQETPTSEQTPPTQKQGNGKTDGGEKVPADLPIADYDKLTVEEVVGKLAGLDDKGRARILAHERANKKREGVITPLVGWNT